MSISLKDVEYIYDAGTERAVPALSQINLTVHPGEILGILGPTGSGKSTLIQHFNGLLKPTSGTVTVDGEELWVKGTSLTRIRQKVGVVFQYPEHQLFEETVWEDVAFGPKNLGLEPSEIKRRVETGLKQVGIEPQFWNRSPFALSGGQKRRVAIAGVLATEPHYLVLDEPTAGLDPAGRQDLLTLLKKLHETRNLGIVYVSHNMEELGLLASRLVVLHRGRIVMEGPPAEVFARVEEIRSLGLDIPQTVDLGYRLQKLGWPIRSGLFTPEECAKEIMRALAKVSPRDGGGHH
ncbi:MAG TPA: energy-coupling factor transporter ATPase [Firmicutes bacterium]|nr:energy-coupling factor transporter ATPase [Bacillota bacterium]